MAARGLFDTAKGVLHFQRGEQMNSVSGSLATPLANALHCEQPET